MSRQFEPGRAVEITFPKYGSGYRIGGRLVLTAAHLLPISVGSSCRVRAKQRFEEVEAAVVWKAQGWDMALIELPEPIAGVAAITLGKLPDANAGEKLAFQMYAYPTWARTQREQGRSAAGGRQIEGLIYLADCSPDGLLVLEAERLPPAVTTAESEWEGVSGAVIVCDGLVVAVQCQHQNPRRPASLEASPLWKVYADVQWQQLMEKHGINPVSETASLSRVERPIQIESRKADKDKVERFSLLGQVSGVQLADYHGIWCPVCLKYFFEGETVRKLPIYPNLSFRESTLHGSTTTITVFVHNECYESCEPKTS
jgi:hypothetical protein